jgi:hypothetical protein
MLQAVSRLICKAQARQADKQTNKQTLLAPCIMTTLPLLHLSAAMSVVHLLPSSEVSSLDLVLHFVAFQHPFAEKTIAMHCITDWGKQILK